MAASFFVRKRPEMFKTAIEKKNKLIELKNKKEYNLQFLLENIEYENKKLFALKV